MILFYAMLTEIAYGDYGIELQFLGQTIYSVQKLKCLSVLERST